MKLTHFTKRNFRYLFVSLISATVLVSCGTYQSVYTSDGIYDDEDPIETVEEEVVVVTSKKKATTVDDNYFKRELDKLNAIEDTDVFTDPNDYNSYDNLDDDYSFDNDPWGDSSDDKVIVNINFRNRYWNNHWTYWNDWNIYDDDYRYWRYGWGFRYGFYGNYVYQPYYYGYYRNYRHFGFYYHHPFYRPVYYRNVRYYNNRYHRNNYTYTQRGTNYKKVILQQDEQLTTTAKDIILILTEEVLIETTISIQREEEIVL